MNSKIPEQRIPEQRQQPANREDALLELIAKAPDEKTRAKFHTQLIELRAAAKRAA